LNFIQILFGFIDAILTYMDYKPVVFPVQSYYQS